MKRKNKADQFAKDHVMHLHNGEYYAVNITGTYQLGYHPYYKGVADSGRIKHFRASRIRKEFPHLAK